MKELFEATAGITENEQRKLNVIRKLRFLEEKLAEVPEERQEAYRSFVEKSVVRLLQGTTAQEIWHDWKWQGVALPAYRKSIALAAVCM
jgi:hypothetical protein